MIRYILLSETGRNWCLKESLEEKCAVWWENSTQNEVDLLYNHSINHHYTIIVFIFKGPITY